MLTPLDIQNKQFSKSIRGYNEVEVEEYMVMIVKSMEELINVNIETTQRIKALEKELHKYTQMEDTMSEAIVLAQKTSEDLMKTTEEKTKYMIERAELDARKIIDDANNEVIEVNRRYEEAKRDYKAFQTKFKIFLESQLQVIQDSIEK